MISEVCITDLRMKDSPSYKNYNLRIRIKGRIFRGKIKFLV